MINKIIYYYVMNLNVRYIHLKYNYLSDYNNARVLDFQNVANYVSNAVPIQEIARMPWHDVRSIVSRVYMRSLTRPLGPYDV